MDNKKLSRKEYKQKLYAKKKEEALEKVANNIVERVSDKLIMKGVINE